MPTAALQNTTSLPAPTARPAQAQPQMCIRDRWLAEQPASPYAALFPQGSQQTAGEEGSEEEGLRM